MDKRRKFVVEESNFFNTSFLEKEGFIKRTNFTGMFAIVAVSYTHLILGASQEFVAKERNLPAKPINFVFHGGSGSSREEIREAISYGAIKDVYKRQIRESSSC